MTTGPLFGKIVCFAIPLIFSNMLQILFNAADVAVVGQFAGSEALAAVGANTAVIFLLTNLFIGISMGSNIAVARHLGEKDEEAASRAVHTSIAVALVSGFCLIGVGWFAARPFLTWMNTPSDSLELAILYMKIYFAGMPSIMLYQFGSAILRAIGDTRRPMIYLTFAGGVNIVLNLVFVICFQMSVAGVALATIISQTISAILILRSLMRADGCYRLSWNSLCFDRRELSLMVRIGLPAGMQSCLFSISNVMIQSSINSFGYLAVAGSTAASNVENFCNMASSAIFQTAMSFTGQNYGARRYDRILHVFLITVGLGVAVLGLMGLGCYWFGPFFLSLFTNDPQVIPYGMVRMAKICALEAIVPFMDIAVGPLRGMGKSLQPMLAAVLCICGVRILYLYTVFAAYPTLEVLYASYPITWALSGVVTTFLFFYYYRKLIHEHDAETAAAAD